MRPYEGGQSNCETKVVLSFRFGQMLASDCWVENRTSYHYIPHCYDNFYGSQSFQHCQINGATAYLT